MSQEMISPDCERPLIGEPPPWWPVILAAIIVPLYTTLGLVRIPADWGWVHEASMSFRDFWRDQIQTLLQQLGLPHTYWQLWYGLYLWVVALIIPWLLMLVLRRGRPRDFGLRLPNALGFRVLPLSLLIAMPFLYWMVHSPEIDIYRQQFQRDPGYTLLHYTLNMSSEHFLIHGVLLAVFLPGLRWPTRILSDPAPAGTTSKSGILRHVRYWLGIGHAASAYEPRPGAISRFLGLPARCLPAIVLSGLIFGYVHMGKDPRELLLSFPGGVASAYLAFRTNSLLTPFILHASTAALALTMRFMIAGG